MIWDKFSGFLFNVMEMGQVMMSLWRQFCFPSYFSVNCSQQRSPSYRVFWLNSDAYPHPPSSWSVRGLGFWIEWDNDFVAICLSSWAWYTILRECPSSPAPALTLPCSLSLSLCPSLFFLSFLSFSLSLSLSLLSVSLSLCLSLFLCLSLSFYVSLSLSLTLPLSSLSLSLL